MRVTSMVAGLAIVLAACGGEKKAEDQSTTATPEQPAGCARCCSCRRRRRHHDVSMVLEGSTYKFRSDPSSPSRSATWSTSTTRRGGPHNVSFWADSIPQGAADVLKDGACPTRWLRSRARCSPSRTAVYKVTLRRRPGGRVQVLLPAAPRAGHARQDHGAVVDGRAAIPGPRGLRARVAFSCLSTVSRLRRRR